jgi:hypothetical protein
VWLLTLKMRSVGKVWGALTVTVASLGTSGERNMLNWCQPLAVLGVASPDDISAVYLVSRAVVNAHVEQSFNKCDHTRTPPTITQITCHHPVSKHIPIECGCERTRRTELQQMRATTMSQEASTRVPALKSNSTQKSKSHTRLTTPPGKRHTRHLHW